MLLDGTGLSWTLWLCCVWSGSVRCRDLVLQEASVGSKGLAEYLTGVISNVQHSQR